MGREKGWGRVTGSGWRWEGRVWGEMVLGRLICWEKDMGWGRKMVWEREMGWGGEGFRRKMVWERRWVSAGKLFRGGRWLRREMGLGKGHR